MIVYAKVQCSGFYIHVPAFACEWAIAVQGPTGKDRVWRERGGCGFEELLGTTTKNQTKTKKPTEAYRAPALQGLGCYPGLAVIGLGTPGGSRLWQVPRWYFCSEGTL